MAVPNGWKEVKVDGDPKTYYEAKIGNYIGKNGQSVTVFAVTDTAGNFDLYESTPTSLFGSRGNPTYKYNQSDSKTNYTGLVKNKDITNITKAVKIKSFEINQAVGTDAEKETLKNSKGYKSLAQTSDGTKQNDPGASGDNTGGQSGSGTPPETPSAPATFTTTSETFNKNNNKKYNSSFLQYPLNMDGGQDRIVITQSTYKPADLLSGGKFDTKKITNLSSNNRKDELLGTVTLPMPNDISETNITAWGEDNLSSLTALIGGAALSGVSALSDGNVPGTTQKLIELFQRAGGDAATNETIKQLLTLNAAAALTQKAGISFNPEAFRSRITGTAINPNLELLFQGPKLRSFGFQFKMIPRSEEEARNIRYIIKFFKKGMAPKRDASTQYFLGAPNVFDIKFMGNETNQLGSIGKIKTCALQQCSVNYTPDGFYAAFRDSNVDSQPIAVVMQLAFTELLPIYNDNYNAADTDMIGFDNEDDLNYASNGTAAQPPAPAPGAN